MKLIVFIISILISFSAVAKKETPPPTTSGRTAVSDEDIKKIENYLNGITTLVAPFVQEDSKGAKAKGTFYLSRPGRLRWDYTPPTPILIVAKGSLVAYYDKELDQLSHISIDDTLAGILTKPKISFRENGIKIIGFSKDNNEIKITVSQENKEEQGNLTMVFKTSNMDLTRMELIDAIGKKTIIRLETPTYNASLDKKLFAFPRVKTKLRR